MEREERREYLPPPDEQIVLEALHKAIKLGRLTQEEAGTRFEAYQRELRRERPPE